MSLRLIVADDHTLMRAGIRTLLLATMPDVDVREASDGVTLLAQAREAAPDIALVDISMPELNGIEAAARLRTECPGCKIIMLSMHKDEMQVVRAIRAGASGYLLKDAAVAELEQAIAAVQRGEVYLSRDLPPHVREALATEGTADPLQRLSPRQRQILQGIAEGHSTKELAYRLGLSPKTVETHRRELMERLGIDEVAGLTRFAVRHGLTTIDP